MDNTFRINPVEFIKLYTEQKSILLQLRVGRSELFNIINIFIINII